MTGHILKQQNGRDGFDLIGTRQAYQMVPKGKSRDIFVKFDHRAMEFISMAPATENVDIKTNARRIGDRFIIAANTTERFELTGKISHATGWSNFVLAAKDDPDPATLAVSVLPERIVTYAVYVIVADRAPFMPYNERELRAKLRRMEETFALQTNVKFVMRGFKGAEKIDALLGNSELPGYSVDIDAAADMLDRVLATSFSENRTLIFCWDFYRKASLKPKKRTAIGERIGPQDIAPMKEGRPMNVCFMTVSRKA